MHSDWANSTIQCDFSGVLNHNKVVIETQGIYSVGEGVTPAIFGDVVLYLDHATRPSSASFNVPYYTLIQITGSFFTSFECLVTIHHTTHLRETGCRNPVQRRTYINHPISADLLP